MPSFEPGDQVGGIPGWPNAEAPEPELSISPTAFTINGETSELQSKVSQSSHRKGGRKGNQDQKHTAEDAEGGRVELDLLERSKICDKKHDFETLAVQRDQRRTEKNWFGAR